MTSLLTAAMRARSMLAAGLMLALAAAPATGQPVVGLTTSGRSSFHLLVSANN